MFNLGLDLGFFKNKLTAELDYYERKTIGMNRPSDVSMHLTGLFTAPRRNIGDMMNKGLEANVTWNDRKGDVGYMLNFNVGYNKNKLLSWNEQLQRGSVFIDMPYNFIYAFESLGIAQSWQDVYNAVPQGASPGDILLKDVNGDGKIDASDRTIIGSPHPDFVYSFNINAAYKNFDFMAYFYGSKGNQNYEATRYFTDFGVFRGQKSTRVLDEWSPTNSGSMIPSQVRNASPYEYASSSYYVQDASFLKLKNLQVGYNFDTNRVFGNNTGIKKLRAYVGVTNLFTITKYEGLDPEVTATPSTYPALGVDFGVYPQARQYMLGVSLGF